MTDAHDEPDDALVDGLLAKARTKEWRPIMDAHDEAAREMFSFAKDRRVVEVLVEESIETIAAALRKAAADAYEECARLAETAHPADYWSEKWVSADEQIARMIRARGTGGA